MVAHDAGMMTAICCAVASAACSRCTCHRTCAAAPRPCPPSDAARALVGVWELSNPDRDRRCTAHLQARRRAAGPRCHARAELRGRVSGRSPDRRLDDGQRRLRSSWSTPRASCCSSSPRSKPACTRPRRASRTTSCRRSPPSTRTASPTTCSATGSSRAAGQRDLPAHARQHRL